MNKYIGIALTTGILLAQLLSQAGAQSADPSASALDLKGQIGGQTTAQSSPLPFTATSPYSYSEPAGNGFAPQSQPPATAPIQSNSASQAPVPGSSKAARSSKTSKSSSKSQSKHGFSPVGAVLGVPDRAVKSSLGLTDRTAKTGLGLTDRTAKTGLGITGKTTKEIFKAIF